MTTRGDRLRERIAALVLVVCAVGLLGLVEGVRDVSSAGATHRVASVLAYAVLTWCTPALVMTSVGLLLAAVLARRAGPRARASFGGGLGLGGTAALAVLIDGQGVLSGVAAGLLVTASGAWLLARRPGGVFACSAVAAVALVLGLGVCSYVMRPAESFGSSRAGVPVVLIVADALRSDALSAYGSTTPTPHIDGIGKRGWTVPDAVSTSSWTLPSVASLWTAREPGLHGVRSAAGVLDDGLPVLAEQLSEHGYRTAAVISNPILDPRRGFTRGFDVVRADTHQAEASLFWVVRFNRLALERGWISGPNAQRKLTVPMPGAGGLQVRRTGYAAADEVTDDALDLVDALGDEAFFLYVHYFDPHDPYLPHPPRVAWQEPELLPENRETLQADYAGEVAFLDQEVGRLLAGLEGRGLLEQSLVVFTADHGEEFLDHGNWRHRASLYDELVRLPLLVSFPDGEVPEGAAPATASLVDVAPTILASVGVPPLAGARGRDLRGVSEPVTRYAERIEDGHWLASVRSAQQTWIMRLPRGLDPGPEQARAWGAALASNAGDGAESTEGTRSPDGWNNPTWTIPPALASQVVQTVGGFELSSGEHPQPMVRSSAWVVPRAGLLGAGVRVAGSGPRLVLMLEARTQDGWSVVENSRLVVPPTSDAWRDVRLPPVLVDRGASLRWVVAAGDPLAPGAGWRLGGARLGVDDPLLLMTGELYDVRTDPTQLADRFPGAPGAWGAAVSQLLDYLSEGREVSERPLDADELERLRAMGYLR